jgi:hypothetical protein
LDDAALLVLLAASVDWGYHALLASLKQMHANIPGFVKPLFIFAYVLVASIVVLVDLIALYKRDPFLFFVSALSTSVLTLVLVILEATVFFRLRYLVLLEEERNKDAQITMAVRASVVFSTSLRSFPFPFPFLSPYLFSLLVFSSVFFFSS